MHNTFRSVLALLLGLTAADALAAQDVAGAGQRFDVLIRGGSVLDGTGNPSFRADVGIRAGRVVAMGRLDRASATRIIDATGKTVAPGFIDIHSHADDTRPGGQGTLRDPDPQRRSAPNLVMQGITTVVVNQDGRSVWPIREQQASMEELRIGPNAILLVGHGEVRRRAMGDDFMRPATDAEIERMRELVREGMEDGAWGLSSGLEYVPGRWSTTDELVALVEEIALRNGFYISHERSEGADPMWYWPSQDPPGPPTLLDAVMETIEIGERTGATVIASHIKAKGAHYWGTGAAVIQLIESARARGVQIYADQYPYATTGTDGNTVLIPGWALARGRGTVNHTVMLRQIMADPETNAKLRQDIAHEIRRRGGADRVVVFEHPNAGFVGQSLGQLAEARGISDVDMAIALQLQGDPGRRGGGRLRGFSLSELDIEMYAAKNWVATATDGGIALPADGPGTHARFYGTFPRKIRHYALDRGVLSLEDAVRSATSLPARIIGLEDRGLLRTGAIADIVVFDAETIQDMATFVDPHQFPEGIDHVLIAGEAVVENGQPTGALPGKVLTRGPRPRT